MKAIALALFLLAAFSLSARGDFTLVQKVEGKGEAKEIVLKIKGDKIRMEASPQMTMIIDGRTGDMITLMKAQKKIVRISGDKTKAIAEMATKYSGTTSEKTKIVATGKKMTINGSKRIPGQISPRECWIIAICPGIRFVPRSILATAKSSARS